MHSPTKNPNSLISVLPPRSPCLRGERTNPSMPENISIRIDGEYVPAHEGQTILEVARAGGKYIPTLCWLEGTSSRRRLPPLHRGGLRRGPPAARLHHSGAGRHERHHQLRKAHAVPPHRHRVPLRRTQSPVRRLRLQQPLRVAGHGAAPRRHPRALSLRLPETPRGSLPPALSCWTTTAASCARAACASAPRWKARTSGTSARAASAA